jgi:hypothetical protein
MKKVFCVGSILLLSTGWGFMTVNAQQLTSTPETPTPETLTKPTGVRPTLELLSIGAEPRQALRLRPTPKLKQTTTMVMKMDMGLSIEGKVMPRNKIPATVMTFETTVSQVDANGDIHYQFRYINADVQPGSDLPVAALKELRSQIQSLKGINGAVVADNRGKVKSGKFNLPPTLNVQAKKRLKNISQSVEQLSAPLPEPAIGVGAKWRVLLSPKVDDIQLSQSTTYELVKLQNNIATLRIIIDQQAPPQQIINLEKLSKEKDLKVTLKSLTGKGQGQALLKLDQIMPLSASTNMQNNSVMEFMNPAQNKTMTMSTDTKIQLFLKSQ